MAKVTQYKGTGLEAYHNALREAKKHGGDYEAYVKEYYRIGKQLRKAGVKVTKGHKQGLFKSGYYYQGWERADVSSKEDFDRYVQRYMITGNELVKQQYNLIDEDLARKVQAELEAKGLGTYSLERIQARQLPDKVWKKMETLANQDGLTIGQEFFGS